MLGRYEVIRPLASGAMADLLLARARGLEGFERHVVIKRIRADAEDDEAFVEMFLIEARLAAALHHHNIVQVHDIGAEDGKPYFAMEYVHGEDLRRLLTEVVRRGEQVPFPVIAAIVTSVARALHHAHDQRGGDQQPLGIVHRDVSPANIIVGYDGNVKVVDFGIARAAMRRTETQAGMLKGKAPYMAPEQCTGAPVDRRSDVFGLGIVLYELVTARRLFKGDNDFSTMSMVVSGSFPKPSTIRKDLPPDLERIILRALAREPESRYQTAEQMFTSLEQLAVTAEWRTSGSALAAYMTQLFGSRTEPWLATEQQPAAVNVDFDGAAPGLARPPVDGDKSAVPTPITSTKSSPIMAAREDAQASRSGPASTDAATPIKIPEASAPTAIKSGKSAATRVPVKATPPRGKPKTVQVPVPAAKPEAKPETRAETKTEQVELKAAPRAETKTEQVELKAAPRAETKTEQVELDAKPEAKAVAKPETKPEVKADTKPVAKPEAKAAAAPLAVAKSEEASNPIHASEDSHTDVQPLPPAISPHAPRQLRPLPPPRSGRVTTPPATPKLAVSSSPAITPPVVPAADTAEAPMVATTATAAPAVDDSADDFAEEPPFRRQGDATEIVPPLPSPLRTDAPRARRTSTAPATAAMVEETDQVTPAPRPKWMVPAIGVGLVVLAIIVIAIARSGGDDLDAPPETATATEPTPPEPTAAPVPPGDEVRDPSQPRTWANSQQAAGETAGSAATPEPSTPADPVAPVQPEPVAPVEPEPVAVVEPAPIVEPDPVPTEPAVTKPAVTKPAVKKPASVAKKPATIAKTAKPAPKKPATKPKALPKAKWNPNTLLPNKK